MKENTFQTIRLLSLIAIVIFSFSACSDKDQNLFEEGLTLERNGKYAEAIARYSEALEHDRQNAKIHLRIATSYSSMGALDKAGEHYVEALKINPNDLEVRLNYSGYKYKKRNFDDALQELGQIIGMSPESNEAEIARGLIVRVEKAKIRSELIKNLEEKMQTESSKEELFLRLGRAYIGEGDELLLQNRIGEAINEYNKAIQLMPKNGEFHFMFAQLYDRIGDRDNALKETILSSKLDPDNLKYKVALAGLFIQDGKIEEGEKILQKIIETDPNSEEAEFSKRRLEELEIRKKEELKTIKKDTESENTLL
jgi:tetratricopeptide (TPR) repeat protein